MKRRVTVEGKHIMVEIFASEDGRWTASGEHEGLAIQTVAVTANRAASDWAIKASRSQSSSLMA